MCGPLQEHDQHGVLQDKADDRRGFAGWTFLSWTICLADSSQQRQTLFARRLDCPALTQARLSAWLMPQPRSRTTLLIDLRAAVQALDYTYLSEWFSVFWNSWYAQRSADYRTAVAAAPPVRI